MQAISRTDKPVINIEQYFRNPVQDGIIVTFDDGHGSNLNLAVPVLKAYGFTATFFVTTDWIGSRSQWLDWDDIGKLIDQDMDVQAHGHTHRFMNGLRGAELLGELRQPKDLCKRMVGKDVRHLSLPGGRYSKETLKVAGRCGYRTLSTSIPGINESRQTTEPWILKRYVIHQGTSRESFSKIIHCDRRYARRMEARYRMRRGFQSVLGGRLYHRLWSMRNN